MRYYTEENKDYILLRLICLIAAIGAPILSIIWSYSVTNSFKNILKQMNIMLVVLISLSFISLYLLTFLLNMIKKNAYYYICVILYFVGMYNTYNSYLNDFSVESILLLLLISCGIIMIYKKLSHVIFFISSNLILMSIMLNINEYSKINKLFLIIFFFLFYFILIGIVKIKLNMQEEIFHSEEIYRNMVEISPQAIMVIEDGIVEYFNNAAFKLSAANNAASLKGKAISNFLSMGNLESVILRESKALRGDKIEYFEQKFIRLDGSEVDVEVCFMNVKNGGKQAAMAIITDITEQKKSEKEMEHLAYHDTLTGLPNRYLLNEKLKDITANTNIDDLSLTILFIDLDRFKTVNDSLGHNAGDILLQRVAERLLKCLRKDDIVSRYGGDEFVIVLNCIDHMEENSIVQRIFNEFSTPINVQGSEIVITPSIGISRYPEDGDNVELLIQDADTAMYLVKEKGRNNYQYYSENK